MGNTATLSRSHKSKLKSSNTTNNIHVVFDTEDIDYITNSPCNLNQQKIKNVTEGKPLYETALQPIRKAKNISFRRKKDSNSFQPTFYSPQKVHNIHHFSSLPSKHLHSKQTIDFSNETINVVFNDSITKKIHKMNYWTHCDNYNILYNAKKDGLSSRDFNSTVCGHSKVMVIIITEDDEMFGCYQKRAIECSVENQNNNTTQQEFFIFGFGGNYVKKIKKRSTTSPTITTHSNTNENFVFTCYSAFWITTDSKVHFHQSLRLNYDCPDCIPNPLTSKRLNKELKVANLIAVEWY